MAWDDSKKIFTFAELDTLYCIWSISLIVGMVVVSLNHKVRHFVIRYWAKNFNSFVFGYYKDIFGSDFEPKCSIVWELHVRIMVTFTLSGFDRNKKWVEELLPYNIKVSLFQVISYQVAIAQSTCDNGGAVHVVSNCILNVWEQSFFIDCIEVDKLRRGYV